MKDYLFILSESKKEVQEIQQTNPIYIIYDNYLQKYYGETVKENEDFIPMDLGDKIIIVYSIEDIDEDSTENIFDTMQDMLYMRA